MRIRLIAILVAAGVSASAIAADQAPSAAIPVPASCTVSPDATGTRAVVPIADLGNVEGIENSETADLIQVVGWDGSVVNWTINTGLRRNELYPPQKDAFPALLGSSRDQRFQVWADGVGTGQIWDIENRRRVAVFPFPGTGRPGWSSDYNVFGEIVFSPDGTHVAIRRTTGSVLLFETATGKKLAEQTFPEEIRALRFSEDGRRLFLRAADDGRTRWTGGLAELDTRSGEIILEYFDNPKPNSDRNWIVNANGSALVETNDLKALIDAETGKVLYRHVSDYNSYWKARFSADGEFVVANDRFTTWVISARDGRVVLKLEDLAVDEPFNVVDFDIQFAPDNRSVLFRKDGGTAFLVRISDGKTLASLGQFSTLGDFPALDPNVDYIFGSSYPTGEFAFSMDGSRLISRDRASTISIWDARSGNRIRKIGNANRFIQSPSGTWLVTFSDAGTGELWNLAEGRRIAGLGKFNQPAKVSFLNDENRVWGPVDAYGEFDALYRDRPYSRPRIGFQNPEGRLIIQDQQSSALWDLHAVKMLGKLQRTYEDSINVTWIFSGRDVYALKEAPPLTDELWNVSRNRRVIDFGNDGINDIVQVQDGAWFLRGFYSSKILISDDTHMVELGDVRTGQRLLACHMGPFGASFVSRAGRRLLTVDEERHATLWRVGPR